MTEYRVVNPATGEELASYPTASTSQVEAAVAAADDAFRTWSQTTTPEQRGALLHEVARLHRERREELADTIVREMGKIREGALGEVDFAADIFDYYAENAAAMTADQPIPLVSGGEGSALVRRSPLGVLLGIMPWNFPYYQVARFAGPNIVNGNTIILKHAPQCPASAEAIERIFLDAGFPDGAYVNLRATNEQAAHLIADPRVAGVSLTGSERAGAAVAEIAGRHLKKVALELGGSDPFIVLSADNLDAVVQAGVDARLDNTGQACNGAKRFIIVEDLYDRFLESFTQKMAAAKLGDPTDTDTVLGPLSSLAAAERLEQQVQTALAEGAQLALGGERKGAYFPPTVLTEVTAGMEIYREELFGPAAVVYRVADEDAAVTLANDTPFGLGSYVFTSDPAQAERVANALNVGMVYVNVVLADAPELPFGGVKRSGAGRELGFLAADEFVNKKLIRTGA